MELSRRHLAAAGALALGAPTLIRSAHAQSADEATVKKAVEELRTALIKQDKATLDSLTAEQLSYSHSDARLQNKAEFIDGVMTRKGTLKSLEWPAMTVQVVGNNAVVRHLWVSESELDGKVTNTKIGVMQIWQKQDGGWKLLARCVFGGSLRRHSTTLVRIHRPAATFIRGLRMRATSGERRASSIAPRGTVAADVRGFAFIAWATLAG